MTTSASADAASAASAAAAAAARSAKWAAEFAQDHAAHALSDYNDLYDMREAAAEAAEAATAAAAAAAIFEARAVDAVHFAAATLLQAVFRGTQAREAHTTPCVDLVNGTQTRVLKRKVVTTVHDDEPAPKRHAGGATAYVPLEGGAAAVGDRPSSPPFGRASPSYEVKDMDKVQWDEIAEGVAHFGRNYRIPTGAKYEVTFDIWDREWDARPSSASDYQDVPVLYYRPLVVGDVICEPLVKALKGLFWTSCSVTFRLTKWGVFDLRRVLSVETAFPPQTTLRTRGLEWSEPRDFPFAASIGMDVDGHPPVLQDCSV